MKHGDTYQKLCYETLCLRCVGGSCGGCGCSFVGGNGGNALSVLPSITDAIAFVTPALTSGRLMKLVVTEIRDTGSFKSYPQPAGEWVTYKNAPQEVLDVVDQKLRDHTYKHYTD